jgi:predicted nucleic acid-binding protein
MVSLRLDDVPAASRVFVDSSIFIYNATAKSAQCRAFLERCETGNIVGVTSTIVLAEVAHRLMMIEAVATGLLDAGKDVPKRLRARPNLVSQLSIYQEEVERIPLMGIDVIPLDLSTVLRSAGIRQRHGLLVNDSLLVAAAVGAELDSVASADPDFGRVPDLRWYRPDDLA